MHYLKLEKGLCSSLENKIDLSFKFVTLASLLESLSNATSYICNIKTLPFVDNYITSNLIVNLTEMIFPDIKKDLLSNKSQRIKITKDISYTIGILRSFTISYGYNGYNFFIIFTFNMIKNVASTFIMNKLDKLENIDAISFGIVLGFLGNLPKFLLSMKDKSWLELIGIILSLTALFTTNYKILNKTKKINILFTNGKKEILELGSSQSYSTSIFIANIIYNILNKFITNNLIIQSLVISLVPIISYIYKKTDETDNDITEYLQKSEGIIDKIKPGNETKLYINKILNQINIRYSIIGVIIFLISLFIIKIFGLAISPLYIASITNSVIRLKYNINSIKSITNIKGFLKEGGNL